MTTDIFLITVAPIIGYTFVTIGGLCFVQGIFGRQGNLVGRVLIFGLAVGMFTAALVLINPLPQARAFQYGLPSENSTGFQRAFVEGMAGLISGSLYAGLLFGTISSKMSDLGRILRKPSYLLFLVFIVLVTIFGAAFNIVVISMPLSSTIALYAVLLVEMSIVFGLGPFMLVAMSEQRLKQIGIILPIIGGMITILPNIISLLNIPVK